MKANLGEERQRIEKQLIEELRWKTEDEGMKQDGGEDACTKFIWIMVH